VRRIRLKPTNQPGSDGRRLAVETDRALRKLAASVHVEIVNAAAASKVADNQLSSDLTDLGIDLAETNQTIDLIQADLTDVEANLSATQVGQVLFSVDGSTFTKEMPLTSDYGGWISNDDGIMVVMG
jgi:hypothetical protein